MGFLDKLVGRPAQPSEEERRAAEAAAMTAQQQQQQQATSTSGDVLHDISPHAGGGGGFPGSVTPASRLYDPYEGISTAVGGRKAAFQLPEGPEFVFQDEAAARRRGWGENLQFYTGLGYLGGEWFGLALCRVSEFCRKQPLCRWIGNEQPSRHHLITPSQPHIACTHPPTNRTRNPTTPKAAPPALPLAATRTSRSRSRSAPR